MYWTNIELELKASSISLLGNYQLPHYQIIAASSSIRHHTLSEIWYHVSSKLLPLQYYYHQERLLFS